MLRRIAVKSLRRSWRCSTHPPTSTSSRLLYAGCTANASLRCNLHTDWEIEAAKPCLVRSFTTSGNSIETERDKNIKMWKQHRDKIVVTGLPSGIPKEQLKKEVTKLLRLISPDIRMEDINNVTRPSTGGQGQVWVTFDNLKSKNKILKNRHKTVELSEYGDGTKIFIAQSLCKPMMEIKYWLKLLKRMGKIDSYRSINGIMEVKKRENDSYSFVTHLNDLVVMDLLPELPEKKQMFRRSKNLPPSRTANFQVVWCGVETSCPSLILYSGAKSYVFNCGEGFQRLLNQKKIKLTTVDSFYLTRHQWSHIGGLFGMGLTLRDNSQGKISELMKSENPLTCMQKLGRISHIPVYSTSGMAQVLIASQSWRRHHEEHSVRELKVDHSLNRQDDQLKVKAILVYSKDDRPSRRSQKVTAKFWTINSDKPISTYDMSPECTFPAVCYICQFQPLFGRFNALKAEELGIPSGPLRGKLVRGESVVLEDGRTIKSSDVVSASTPGPICIIVDCPSVSYIESLAASELGSYFSGPKAAHMVFHFTPHHVCKDAAYAGWMNSFSVNTKHIFLDGLKQNTLPFESHHSLQMMLNRLDSQFFPSVDSFKCTTKTYSSVKNFTKFFIRESFEDPTKGIDEGDTFPVITTEKIDNIVNKAISFHSPDRGTLNNGKQTVTDRNHGKSFSPKRTQTDNVKDSSGEYPLTVCLGTGSARPSKYRNVSGTLVFLNEDTAVLLDCGEGTYIEMVRHYGEFVDSVLKKIQVIFISHMHPDHHLGLITLVSKLNNLQINSDDLPLIMMPKQMGPWLRNYAETTERMKYRYAWCENLHNGLKMSDTIELRSVKVDHPGFAHGLVITCSDGLKVTYSGDTMPCENLINAGMNSTLLIHEATLDDDMEEDAFQKKHSTRSQALEVARRMQAEWVILTHISQRYPKIPNVKKKDLLSRTVYASDHMEIILDNIPRFSDLVPVMNLLNELIEVEEPFSAEESFE